MEDVNIQGFVNTSLSAELQWLIKCMKYSDEIFAMQGILFSQEVILSSDKDFPAVKNILFFTFQYL